MIVRRIGVPTRLSAVLALTAVFAIGDPMIEAVSPAGASGGGVAAQVSEEPVSNGTALRVFLECSGRACDQREIRTEVTAVSAHAVARGASRFVAQEDLPATLSVAAKLHIALLQAF